MDVPLLMRMAAHPLRWALLTELSASDRRVRELVAAVGEPQNLVSYHLRLLRSAGLVTVRRSNFDGRDSYYHLDLARCGTAFAAAAAALHPALTPVTFAVSAFGAASSAALSDTAADSGAGSGSASASGSASGSTSDPGSGSGAASGSGPDSGSGFGSNPASDSGSSASTPSFSIPSAAIPSAVIPSASIPSEGVGGAVLFLCTGNSARSPMAEALLRHRSGGRVAVASAGSHPKPELHPNAVRVLWEQYGIDLSGHRTVGLAAVAGRRFDYVVTLCDKVREVARDHGSATTVHWSLPDPPAAGPTDEASYPEFRRVAEEIDLRNQFLLPLLTSRSADHVELRG